MLDKFRIEIDMEQMVCSSCKKASVEYYELLVQIRYIYFKDENLIKTEIFDIIDKKFDSINKIEEKENGFDFYFRVYGLMNKISSLFSRKYMIEEKRSKKVVGKDQLTSKDKHRYFMGITIININKGDKVKIKGEEFFVKAVNGNSVLILNDAKTGAKRQESYSIIKDYLQKIEVDED